MVNIIKRNKALSVNPLKSSQTIGAALAFLGFKRAMPMLHGAQGCSAFGKIFFVRHFREPIPLQTSAMEQVSTVMGADENIVEGLKAICEKNSPSLVGIPTTGLSETQGCDVKRSIHDFREKYPEFKHIPVVAVTTADYIGCMESGFASAVTAIINSLVPQVENITDNSEKNKNQVTVLGGSFLTTGDLEMIKQMIESFDLQPVLIPDLSDSLDGHLPEADFSPLTIGGTSVEVFSTLQNSIATLVIGPSMYKAGDLLHQRTGVPMWKFEHLMGIDAVDEFVNCLFVISGKPVPEKIERARSQCQDAMLDSHFMIGLSRVAIAADGDLLNAFSHLLDGLGAKVVAAVAPANSPALKNVCANEIKLGDLEDMEKMAIENQAEFIISNSHALETSKRLHIPLLRAGFPQYDLLGGYQKVWVGYQGTRQSLFDIANILISLDRGEVEAYQSIYSRKQEKIHNVKTAFENTRLQH